MIDSATSYDVPGHWTRATIADTGSYVNGMAFKNTDWHDDGLPIIRIQNLTDDSKPFNLTRKEAREESRVFDGDILVSWSATLDAFRWRRGPAVLNQHIFKVFPNDDLVRGDFLFYLLKEAIAEMSQSAHAHGSTMKHINRGPFLAHEVFIPPLDEQKQIVDEIETQFARLDDAVAALSRSRTRLKRYRASVLKAACEGRLVPTERELARQEGRDYEPASVLLERIKAEREANAHSKRRKSKKTAPLDTSTLPKLPEGWEWTTVDSIASEVRYGTSVKTNEDGHGIPVLRMGNIVDGKLDYTSLKYLDRNHHEFPELLLKRGDLLFNRTNSAELVGKSAVYKASVPECSFVSYLIRVRISHEYLPDFAAYYINSVHGRNWIRTVVNQQVGQANVNGTKLKALAIPIPPDAELERIASEVERRFSVIEQLEATVETNLKRTEALRQSILRKAFSGRLVRM